MDNAKSVLFNAAAWFIAGVLLYALLLRASVNAHWALRAVGVAVLLALPFMAIDALAHLIWQSSLNPIWMFAPLLLTLLLPEQCDATKNSNHN